MVSVATARMAQPMHRGSASQARGEGGSASQARGQGLDVAALEGVTQAGTVQGVLDVSALDDVSLDLLSPLPLAAVVAAPSPVRSNTRVVLLDAFDDCAADLDLLL